MQEPEANQDEEPEQNDGIATDEPDRRPDQKLQRQSAREELGIVVKIVPDPGRRQQ